MSKVVLGFSMSLDGFVAGPDVSMEQPMGLGGERLHDWMFKEHSDRSADQAIVQDIFAATGAVVLGKRTFELGVGPWGDTPFPVPSFVVTHERREPLPMKSASFVFVNDGIENALARGRDAAGGKDVAVMGADVAQQVLETGLADELRVTLVPVLLGGGTRLFDNIGDQPIELTRTKAVETEAATHLRFSVRHRKEHETL